MPLIPSYQIPKNFVLTGLMLIAFHSAAQERGEETAQAKVVKLIETRQLIAEEAAKWQSDKQMLLDLAALREREASQMDEVINLAKERVSDIEAKRNALTQEENQRRAWRENFEKRIAGLERSLLPRLNYLPPPVVEKLHGSIERIKNRDGSVDLQNRFRDVLAVLNECIAFDSSIHFAPEIRAVDGRRMEVEVLYLGMHQAWYVDRTGKSAGVGLPTAEGWIWQSKPEIASRVRTAIDIHQKNIAPAFTRLPIQNGKEVNQ